jgi:nicotinamidase-related amidase
MLNDFVKPDGALPVPAAIDLVPCIQQIIAHAREVGWIIIFIADNHAEDDKEFDIWPRHSVKGTEGAQVVDALAPQEGDYIVAKTRYSGFYNTNLQEILVQNGVDQIVIVGVMTDICVLYTSADARNRDMTSIIVADATATLSDERQAWALEHARSVTNAQTMTCEEVLQLD